MANLSSIFSESLLQGLGWAVLHSLWQAALVALIVGGLSFLFRRQKASVRYWIAKTGLGLVLLAFILTFYLYYSPENTSPTVPFTKAHNETVAGILILEDPGIESPDFFAGWVGYFQNHLPLIVSVWLLGMVLFFLKFLGGVLYLQHLRIHRSQHLGTPWVDMLERLAASMNVRKSVYLADSAWIRTPMVIGWVKPAILLPVGMVNQLTQEQVEAVLAHELGHIKRYDFLFNLLQSLAEVLLYFNPAVWWISSIIRTERENCCDDMAIAACGNSIAYAKALVQLQEWSHPSPRLAQALAKSEGHLLNRVKRILKQPVSPPQIRARVLTLGLLVAALVGFSFQKSQDIPSLDNHTFPNSSEITGLSGHENEIVADTIPREDARVKFTTDGELIEAEIKNGKIISLKVNGKAIPATAFEGYEQKIGDLMEQVPTPPRPIAPTPPPVPLNDLKGVVPPPPPAPPVGLGGLPTPPAPPAPPAPMVYVIPEVVDDLRPSKVITRKNEDGSTYIIVEPLQGNDSIKIELDLDAQNMVIDEMEIEPGETTILFGDVDKYVFKKFDLDSLSGYAYRYGQGGIHLDTGDLYFFDEHFPGLKGQWLGFGKPSKVVEFFSDSLPEEMIHKWQIKPHLGSESEEEWLLKMKENGWEVEQMPRESMFELLKGQTIELKKLKEIDGKQVKKIMEELRLEKEKLLEFNAMAGRLEKEKLLRELDLARAHAMAVQPHLKAKVLPGKALNEAYLPKPLQPNSFEEALISDGLIELTGSYSFEITTSYFKVNGKKQPESIHQRYLQLYETINGEPLKGKSKVSVRKTKSQ